MKSIRYIRNLLRKERLTDEERQHVRAYLRTIIDENPVKESTLVHRREKHSSGRFTLLTRPAMASILIGVLLLGTGTVAAAENTLPGDTLYPVKISFNEEVRAMLALSPQAKAEWSHQRAERRLIEAEQLAAQGELNDRVTAELEKHIERHAEHMETVAKSIEAAGNTELAASVRSDFEAALNAHGDIIIHIGQNTQPPSRSHLAMILDRVGRQLERTSVQREELESLFVQSIQEKIPLQEKADAKIEMARRSLELTISAINNSKSDTDTKAAAQARLEAAQKRLEDARSEYETEEYADAIRKAQDASRIAHEAQILITTADRIGVSIRIRTNANGNINVNVALPEDSIVENEISDRSDDDDSDQKQLEKHFELMREQFENEREAREREFEEKRNRIHDQLKKFFEESEDEQVEVIVESRINSNDVNIFDGEKEDEVDEGDEVDEKDDDDDIYIESNSSVIIETNVTAEANSSN